MDSIFWFCYLQTCRIYIAETDTSAVDGLSKLVILSPRWNLQQIFRLKRWIFKVDM